jgi:hypothetical protein
MQNGRSPVITYPLNSGRLGGQMFEALPPSKSCPCALLNTRTRSCGFRVASLWKKPRRRGCLVSDAGGFQGRHEQFAQKQNSSRHSWLLLAKMRRTIRVPERRPRILTAAAARWYGWRDSNPRHPVPETGALSAELQPHAGPGQPSIGRAGFQFDAVGARPRRRPTGPRRPPPRPVEGCPGCRTGPPCSGRW